MNCISEGLHMVAISLFPLSIGKSDMWSLLCCYCWGNCTLIYYILYQAITFKQLSFFLHFHGGAFFKLFVLFFTSVCANNFISTSNLFKLAVLRVSKFCSSMTVQDKDWFIKHHLFIHLSYWCM